MRSLPIMILFGLCIATESVAADENNDAIKKYTEMVRKNPKDAKAYYSRAVAWHYKQEFDSALRDYAEAIRLNPRFAAAFFGRAFTWIAKDNFDKALKDYNDAIRINPRFAQAYYNRGLIWRKKNQLEKAISDYSAAIRLRFRDDRVFNGRGIAWAQKGEFDKAIKDYDESLRLNPKSSKAYFNRGLAWHRKREYRNAISDFRSATRLRKSYIDAHGMLAWLLSTTEDAALRDGKQAVKSATTACELSQWKAPFHLDVLAAAYAETGDFKNAVKWQTKAIDLAPKDQKSDYESRLQLYKSGKPFRLKR